MSLQNPLIANEAMYSKEAGDYFYPQTVDKQVIMKNGNRLDAYLAGMVIPDGIELLWENPDPTSGFGPQTINLDLSNYSFVKIVFRLSALENTNYQFTEFARVDGHKYLSSMSWDGTDYNREYFVNSDNIRFGNSNQGGNVNIPMYIYGIKKNVSLGGEGTLLNADMLGNVSAEEYVKKSETGMELLWQNANPTSVFNAQTITLALSSYKMVLIEPYQENERAATAIIPVGGSGALFYNNGGSVILTRRADVSTTKIVFTSGRDVLGNSEADWTNSGVVPYKIYGIK